ncbi:hypothetical protein BGW36DRAFT_397449 [Talaromyces proteolyticus]|uniref:FAD-binding PCMH-type domain-containing protein n=1 Tax=Talaromyces proteolyticus TaxID=1131652 RepID=A0AAD4KRS0_9EURO|nr:uncharacterized protein BGW36DRAFT_397449 [Talaromyces proteolyticus]KAH8697804.1 hypothetical protein BGW36DRAFT_397449 [Talaromyces proteolyticus]
MRAFISLLLNTATYLNWANAASNSTRHCKPLPSSPDWPSLDQWHALNQSVSGRLHAPVPAGSVCHPGQPGFSNTSCTTVQTQWSNSTWHAGDPWSVDYNDDTCLPDPSAPCSSAGYPAYVVEAVGASDVQAAVKFAKRTGVRLVVKGTGHDFPGRSSGPGSLSIWTHRIRGIDVTLNDTRATAYGGAASLKIAAGSQWKEIYDVAAAHNLTAVGGGDVNVGIGGWILGGGHSPVSSWYGLGADQILELEVVTADGEYRVVNEKSYPDLFWALRGGGPSTFAVLISVTVKAYSPLSMTVYTYEYNTTANSNTFWSLTAYFHQQLPHLSDSGAMGYYFIWPSVPVPQVGAIGQINGIWFFPEKTPEQVKEIIAPIEKVILSSPSWANDSIVGAGIPEKWDNFMDMYAKNTPQTVGTDGRLASWLLDRDALSKPLTILKNQLYKSSPSGYPILGHMVAGKGVRDAIIPGGNNSVSPHWRNAIVHEVIVRSWPELNITAKNIETNSLRNEANPALKALAPNSGAYVNEADPTIPDWQRVFWGDHYPRLFKLKKKWDPEGVFWCKPCVGHELWDVFGPDTEEEVEWGIGQVGGKICRK